MKSFLLCCFQKNPDDRPTASQLKNHIWLRTNKKHMKRNKTYTNNLAAYANHPHIKSSTPSSLSISSSNYTIVPNTATAHHRQNIDEPLSPLSNHDNDSYLLSTYQHNNNKKANVASSPLFPDFGKVGDYITHQFIETSFGKRKRVLFDKKL